MSFKKSGIIAPNPITTRGVSTKLSASKGKIVYANGKAVIIHDLNNPLLATAYSGHVQNTTVARISPSGYYCASADVGGTVRIWDTVGEDQTLKGEYKVMSGRINDLDWDGESKRIVAVGDGREKFGHAFMMDSGSSTGEISGHSKAINSVSIRHQRPYRAATAADDGSIVFHQGVPFKYDRSIKTHTKFVQDVRYAASGDHFASVGSDGKIFVYDGKTGDTLGEFTENGHKGSIMACTWSPDSKSLATSSADCTVKLWDVETRKATTTWTLGSGVNHQQVGNVWSGEKDIVSLSISGDLNVFDPRVGDKPTRVYRATQKSITATATSGHGTFLGGAADGRVFSFSGNTGECTSLEGEGHSNLVSGIASVAGEGKIVSIGYDDRVREIGADGQGFLPASAPTSFQPRSLAVAADSTVFVAEINTIEAFRSNQRVLQETPKYAPSSVAASQSIVAIGGEDQKIHLNHWDGKVLKETDVLEGNKGVVSALAFSPDGNLLAAGDSSGRIALFDVKEKKLITSRWSFHSARVNSIAWTPDSLYCASASLDTHVYIWSVAKPMKNIAIKNAVPGGANAVLWLESSDKGGKLTGTGADACVRFWEVTFHA
ncbi:WD40-repeat-containing domain protein [Collybia nuda]|uniref:WD40-repeat-containing domain protein n=1 Tax=Collybia nuda TaxID=64659 RepID=A0A9P6CB01_9AGAR|nr:WD40-repeat-containing domain protein [Collybia nuda]